MTKIEIVVPGQKLVQSDKLRCGLGTYVRDTYICASIAGVQVVKDGIVSVERTDKTNGTAQVLRLNDVVICRVTKITSKQAIVDIVCVNESALHEPFPGTIRLEDVRTHDIDKLVMDEVFSPGCLIKAVVLSYGDTRSYFLSTARENLGVVCVVPPVDEDNDADMN
jgi:exosome complex component CSL4